MKKPNLLFALIVLVINLIFIYFKQLSDYAVYAFLLGMLLLMAFLAIDCRSLNYIKFNEKQYKRQAIIIIDFITKCVTIILILIQYFINVIWIYVLLFVLSIFIGVLYFFEIKWLKNNAVYDDNLKDINDIKTSIYVLISFLSYLVAVCLAFFPNYKSSTNILWIIPLMLMVAIYFFSLKRLNYGNKNLLLYLFLFILSLSWFVLTKYIFLVETPISIFTIIGLLIMMPNFKANADKLRKINKQ